MTYKLIDSGNFKKLEQIGQYKIIRPAAQAVWEPKTNWPTVDSEFIRNNDGSGKWTNRLEDNFDIEVAHIKFRVKFTSFGHLGIFAEQKNNWMKMRELIQASNKSTFKVLNLFAYTGGSTLACAQAGASVTHLDASKTSVNWAKENASINGISSVRWIVDDVQSFIAKEIRRENKYDGLILDPPSFGRGSKNQIWKIEDHLIPLIKDLKKIVSEDFRFILLSAHSEGYTPTALEQLIDHKKGHYHSTEMLIKDDHGRSLPSGASSLWSVI